MEFQQLCDAFWDEQKDDKSCVVSVYWQASQGSHSFVE